uniref:ABC transmembrane type-1 domain-containing protein n=1 Tax=Setaria digitata TaxID=48799 RepID=A0A915PSR8_9BILA
MPSISALSPHYYKSFYPLKNDEKSSKSLDSEHHTSTCCANTQRSAQSLFCLVLQSQTAYAQYMKLITLFVFAVVHAMYMIPFLNTFAAVASNVDVTDVISNNALLHLRHFVETLADYKKNMWMIVGSMCVALSTSCFILMLNASSRKATYDIIVRLILLNSISEQLPIVLHEIQFLPHFKQLSTTLHCSFVPVVEVPLCIQVIQNALFPIYIIKFLIILAILTIAYMLLAYLIEWCLRHWFPPQCSHSKRSVYASIAMAL